MKKNKLLLALVMSSLLAGCNGNGVSSSNSVNTNSQTTSSKVSSSVSTEVSSSLITSSSSSSSLEETLTVSILGNDVVWCDETLTLTYEFSKETTEEVTWTSSDESIATVENGVVTPLKQGEVTITITGVNDSTLTDSKVITVKDTVIDMKVNDGGFDFTQLKQDVPVLKTQTVNGGFPYETVANFKNVTGQKYYAEATFKMTGYNATNTWNRFAIGHRSLTNDAFRAYHVSYGTGDVNSIKTVVMDMPLVWGTTTDRTQVWNQGGRSAWNFDSLKFATLRDGNKYYYYINDELSWVENVDAKFKDIDTLPAITVSDMHVEVSNMYATSDETLVNEKLNASTSKSLFWSTFADYVVIDETNDNPTIKFNNTDKWPCDNIKDFAAWSKGDALTIQKGQSGTFTFDFTVDAFGSDIESSYAGLTFKLYDEPKEMRTIMLGKYNCLANAWGWDGGITIGSSGFFQYEGSEFGSSIKEGETYKVEISATVENDYRWFELKINDKATGLKWGDWNKYTGALNVGITAFKMGVTISNFSYTIG